MCWESYSLPVKKIADKDITVYKILKEITGSNKICSPIYDEWEWTIDDVYRGDKPNPNCVYEYDICLCHKPKKMWTIKEGLHSLRSKPYFIRYASIGCWWKSSIDNHPIFQASYNEHVYECIIPKGSIYYENEIGDIVSNALIIKGKVSYEIKKI